MIDTFQQKNAEIVQINDRLDKVLNKSRREKAPEWRGRFADANKQFRSLQDNHNSEFQTLLMQDTIVSKFGLIIEEYLVKIKKDKQIWEDWQKIKSLHTADVEPLIEKLQGSLGKQMEKREVVKQLEQQGKYMVINLFASLMRIKDEKPQNMNQAMLEEEESVYEKANEFFKQLHRSMVYGTIVDEWKEIIGSYLSKMQQLVAKYPMMKKIIRTENEKLDTCLMQISKKGSTHCYPTKKIFSWSNSPVQAVLETPERDDIIPTLVGIVQDSLSRSGILLVIELRSFLDPERRSLSQQLKQYVENVDAWAEKKKRQCSNQQLNTELLALQNLCKDMHRKLSSKIKESAKQNPYGLISEDYEIERFLLPQQEDYARALVEIKAGYKYSHWIWYIFPQLRGLGKSRTARFYGIANLKEAKAYLAQPILYQHLLEISQALLKLDENDPLKVMGSPDDKKLCSSMTLFALADPEEEMFPKVLEKFYHGAMDPLTIRLLGLQQKPHYMLGAIIGDIVGSRYERNNNRSKDFKFFDCMCHHTDDTIMTLAVAKAVLLSNENYSNLSEMAIKSMYELGNKYPHAGYGRGFRNWLASAHPQPYNSYGNGAAMRISPVGWAAKSLDEVKMMSEKVTEVTHGHPEGLKGAEAVAVAIFMARQGKTIAEIKKYINDNYYPLDTSIDRWREINEFNSSCQGSVPQAITAFVEAKDFEDTIRNAVSIGGDSDTIAAIAGSIAEAYFGVPQDIRERAVTYLDERLLTILTDFESKYFDGAK